MTPPATGPHPLTVGTTLAVDTVTAEVVRALRRAGVASILLRGAALSRWLYGDTGTRSYRDVDLLVSPSQRPDAERVLEQLGFVHRQARFGPGESSEHSGEWLRAQPAVVVDLHRTVEGAAAGQAAVWEALADGHDEIEVAAVPVDIPAVPARALVVTLHAAQHGVEGERQIQDLGRALERSSFETWVETAHLAERLEAVPAFAIGLRLLPEGAGLAERLRLPMTVDAETTLRASSASATSIGFARLVGTPGARAKASIVRRKLFPSTAFMRHWSPLARRGPLGLGLAYLWRPLWLVLRLLPSALAWRRARR